MPYTVFLFDFDGTIADTFEQTVVIWNHLSRTFRFKKIEPEDIPFLKDSNSKDIIRYLKVPALLIPLIVSKGKKEMNKVINDMEPIQGLKEILLKIKSEGYEIGIFSSNSKKNVMEFLNRHDLDIFNFIYTSAKIWKKNKGLKRFMKTNNYDASEILYVGDEIRDVQAAQKAGVHVAAVSWGFNSGSSLKKYNPDYLLQTPHDLIHVCQINHPEYSSPIKS
ncbi:MAG: HAD-IA family hydrolase [Candidatus Omnitrophica bacterium]|nr:HAD-IA family hydrolase [Candidatus Omnitrophota bacterium]